MATHRYQPSGLRQVAIALAVAVLAAGPATAQEAPARPDGNAFTAVGANPFDTPVTFPNGVCQLVSAEQPLPPQQNALPPEQKLGEKPQDYSHEFLRQESVLLPAGQWQCDISFSYTLFQHNYTALTQAGNDLLPVDSRLTRRLMLLPLDVRYGITDRLQGFVDVPFGWSNTEYSEAGFVDQGTFYPGVDDYTNRGGIGDVSAGVSWLFHKSCGSSCDPDMIATFSVTAPTADVNPLQGILEPPNTMLGQGFWYGGFNVLFIHTLDPLVVFYGFGARFGLTREFEGYEITPGAQYLYRAGVGFAVSERVTLSASLLGYYITDPELNHERLPGLAMEPITLRFAATIVRPCERFWEPFVEIGLTDDAPNARVGLTYTF
jgi:hypothetical protein